MNKEEVTWLIVRFFGVALLILSSIKCYELIGTIFSFNDLVGHSYSQQEHDYKNAQALRVVGVEVLDLLFFLFLAYYFLKKGKRIFNLLSCTGSS